MNEASAEIHSVIVEREFPHPPEKLWRALTQPHLIAEWLMKNDFKPVVGHRFDFSAEWGAVSCEVLEIEPARTLSYSWGDHELKTVVTWTLTPAGAGTALRMEQTGFRENQPRYFQGARAGWPRFLAALEELLARMG
ncbi:SRPBCC domain-containing protein [Bosea sp. F3-2]|uniref:SRPBCC family protein n=1 Tax=Bosea sp. F3-2 TaxID=2599640 RepID=UPI0011EFEE26|nr:SRPBCC domain-containing protein [Bosea sp. F3-2]QEL24073.1 SRPBCC domain-containing protein [Bosea sp. F3-2]